ncbi:MAG TPA: DCC1-like thiol-disulfide oxidoreductase family protein [Solirubrobacterales bacterium]|jgi:predicted DCC family thiol-disulfide oxidoreductase YuxK
MTTATVIYDADCGFCRWSLALLLSLDRPGALRPLPLGTEEADLLLADLTAEERNASWHLVVDADPGAAGGAREPTDPGAPLPTRFSAGAALAPALALLPRGRRAAALVAREPELTERGYRWVADHRGLLGRFVPARARRWADQVIAAGGGPART